jgi:uncharacterized membrane protein YhaH (DUF805 family)
MSFASSDSPPPSPSPKRGWGHLLRLWFGVSEPVNQASYILSGFGLMLLKYCTEALLFWTFTSTFLTPLDFLNPTMDARRAVLQPGTEWLAWVLFLWTMPFLWIAVSMSVRRATDAGRSPWIGLMVLIPVVNLIVMLALSAMPSAEGEKRETATRKSNDRTLGRMEDHAKSAALAVGLSLLIGGLMLWTSVYAFSTYGASLFLGTPMLMGTTASYIFNREHSSTIGASALLGVASVSFAMCALLLFALEGVICVAMAAPLVLPIGAMGGLIGKAIADATRRSPSEFFAAVLVLPLWAGGESLLIKSREHVVLTAVDVDAPATTVWNNVVDFPEITEPEAWYFSCGIACPERARIVGQGPGAIRYCEFTTGTFVEPITVWEQPRRLAFDVTEQPEPLRELSPFRNVHPPHLNLSLRSNHGEFRLIALGAAQTRLEGRTWYTFDMFPQWYWTVWSDVLIHRIHERVLVHIKTLSEAEAIARTGRSTP